MSTGAGAKKPRKPKVILPASPGLITHRDVATKVGVSCETLREWIDKDSFPQPHSQIENTLLYRADLIEAWLQTGQWSEGVRWKRPRIEDDDR